MATAAREALTKPETLTLDRTRTPSSEDSDVLPSPHHPVQVGDWKIILESGQVCIRVTGFPTQEEGLYEDLWVKITQGDDFEGEGVISSLPTKALDFKYPCKILYGYGSSKEKPVFIELLGD